MKKLSVALALLMLAGACYAAAEQSPGQAQGAQQSPAGRPTQSTLQILRFKNDLNLSSDQVKRIQDNVKTVTGNPELKRLREQYRDLTARLSSKAYDDSLAVLTPEQKTKFEQLSRAEQEKMRQMREKFDQQRKTQGQSAPQRLPGK